MKSPTLEGFRLMLTRPSFGLAEIAWRWSFGAAAGLLVGIASFEYLDSLPVSHRDMFLLRSAQPVLISQAMRHIFHGSAFRLIEAGIVLTLGLGIAWVIIATLARAATIKELVTYLVAKVPEDTEPHRTSLRPLFALNALRLLTTLAAAAGLLAAFLLGGVVSRPDHPAPGSALLIVLTVFLMVWCSWSALNWFLSLAAIFAVAEGKSTTSAIASSIDLCRTRSGSVFAAGTWFGLAHLTAFVLATSAVAFPVGFVPILPAAVVVGGVLLITLLYFATADFLYIGRLAAYVAILKTPDAPVVVDAVPPPLPGTGAAVDPTELILSDLLPTI